MCIVYLPLFSHLQQPISVVYIYLSHFLSVLSCIFLPRLFEFFMTLPIATVVGVLKSVVNNYLPYVLDVVNEPFSSSEGI